MGWYKMRNEMVVKSYEEGMPIDKLVMKYNLSVHSIQRILNDMCKTYKPVYGNWGIY